jgi:hypothetical protein
VGSAFHAFDRDSSTAATLLGASGAWIQIDLGSSYVVNNYGVWANGAFSYYFIPGSWQLQGSTDGIGWTTLHVMEQDPFYPMPSADQRYVCYQNIGNTTAYRYYRLLILSNHGGIGTAIGELRLAETT